MRSLLDHGREFAQSCKFVLHDVHFHSVVLYAIRVRMTSHDVLKVLLPQWRIAEQRPDQLCDLLNRKVDQVAVVEQEDDIGLS